MRTFSDMRGANWSVGSLARRPNPEGLYVVADAGIISKGEQGVASPRKFAGLRYGTGTTGVRQHREGGECVRGNSLMVQSAVSG